MAGIATGLHVLTDPRLSLGRVHPQVARAAIAGGASVIQLREKDASTLRMVEIGQRLRELTREAGVSLIVNDRVDVALAVDADGVHVGQDDMPISLARKLIGERCLGVSARSLEEAVRAEREGADYLGVGPVFPTESKADAAPAMGLEGLRTIVARVSVPVVAIGGIKLENVDEVMAAGAVGVAVISAVVSAPDVEEAARRLNERVRRAAGEARCLR